MQKSIYSRENRLVLTLLRDIREARGFTQEQLAEKLEMAQSQLSKKERGARRLDFVELHHWLLALDFDVVSCSLLFQERLAANQVEPVMHKIAD
jgi:transcriptional regulator with XRE-family HTH domain